MHYDFRAVFGVICAVCIAFYVRNSIGIQKQKDFVPLAIAVISARENFEQRQSIRSTWLNTSSALSKSYVGKDFKAWFIVGSKSCPFPPICSHSKYVCSKWDLDLSGVSETFYSSKESTDVRCSANEKRTFHQGFSFQVNHPVIITKLGVCSKLLPPDQKVSVSLLDLQTKKLVVHATLTKKNFDVSKDGFIYRNVDNFLLPKRYHGLVLVEGYLLQSSCATVNWNNNSGIVSFTKVFVSSDIVESITFSDDLQVAPGVAFQVQNMTALNESVSQCEDMLPEWEKYNEQVSKRLHAENEAWGDLVFVDVLDTYRNLPRKLLSYYDWLAENFKFHFVLKTDDDSIIDIENVLYKLEDRKKFDPEKLWLWSRFRYRWPVNYVGKWTDLEYKSPVYPTFPCGGGYVLPASIVSWLHKNSDNLYPYQGEDVSLGIWMTAINPIYIEDNNWECDNKCTQQSYNMAQLSISELLKSWSLKTECGNLCSCGASNT